MLKNYFLTAFRNLLKNKVFSFINVFGLSVGLACCMLITMFVYDELSYDKYAPQASQIYRVNLGVLGNANLVAYPMVDVAVGEGIKKAFPEVQASTRILTRGESFVSYGDKQFKEEKLAFADENFLQIFPATFLEGDAQNALSQPNSIVITKKLATKYFGNEHASGKLLTFGKNEIYKVTGVIEKIPDNSHFHFDVFISMSTLHLTRQTWSNVGFYTYLVLNKNTDPKKLESKFPELVAKYVVPEIQHDMGASLAEAQKAVNTFRFTLIPLTDIHLYSDTKYELEANGDIQYVYIFGALAVFILLLACVNFTNLSTASSAKRAREVGIRKVVGSLKRQLIFQFLTESILLTCCAMLLAFVLVIILLPYFNQLSGKHFNTDFIFNLRAIAAILGMCLLVGALAGIYPAFFLSSFNTIKVLKGSGATLGGGRKSILRSGLVVFQFFVSTALIIATIIVYRQLHYMQDKKLGYNKEQVVFLQDTYLLGANQYSFKQQLLQDTRVVKVSIGRNAPVNGLMEGTEIYPKTESNENGKEIHTNIFNIDEDYVPTLGMQLVQGRNFSKDFPTDSSGVIINEAAVRDLGWSNTNPIGKTIVRSGRREFKVVGVVADFHYASVKQKIAPLMMILGDNYGGMLVKVKTADVRSLLTDIKKQWIAFKPNGPFAYYFLDDKFASLYTSEQRTGQIFTSFAIIAVLIAGLGLFGLAAFITEQRTREIGIRKVLGASIRQVLLLVSKEFLILVGIAFIIAIPATWLTMNKWLQDFAYRIDISWWIYALSGLLAIFIALFTVSFQAIKAALANPVKSLRSE